MKKIMAILFCVVIHYYNSFGGIGDNFSAAGIWIGGDGSFHVNDIGGANFYYSYFTLNQNFLVVDNLAIEVSERFIFDSYGFTFSAGLGSIYSFVMTPQKSKGIVNSVGLRTGLSFDESGYRNTFLFPFYTFQYFVTDRISPYIRFGPYFRISKKTIETDGDIYIGLSLHFPTQMRVNIRI